MLSYKLAKKLKDAGFPQLGDGWALIPDKKLPESEATMTVIDWNIYCQNTSLHHKKMMYCPTLSELIEACEEDKLYWIKRRTWGGQKDQWEAKTLGGYYGFGKTPSEAVAKLWLKLNKK